MPSGNITIIDSWGYRLGASWRVTILWIQITHQERWDQRVVLSDSVAANQEIDANPAALSASVCSPSFLHLTTSPRPTPWCGVRRYLWPKAYLHCINILHSRPLPINDRLLCKSRAMSNSWDIYVRIDRNHANFIHKSHWPRPLVAVLLGERLMYFIPLRNMAILLGFAVKGNINGNDCMLFSNKIKIM